MSVSLRWEPWALFCLLAAAEEVPKGHLQPFGSWTEGTPIEERWDVPEPEDFWNSYCNVNKGIGKPVVFRGAAKEMASVQKWNSDKYLLEKHGNEEITGVEYNLKETRAGGYVNGMEKLKDFLGEYNKSDIYMVSALPKGMGKEMHFLPSLRCGGYLNFLDMNNIWIGRGGSKSVVHYDDQDNINCMIDGKKRFVFMHPSYKKQFEAHPNSNKNKFGWVDTLLDKSVPGYGAFFGKLDVDKVDLIKFPGWKKVKWSYVDLGPGDCLYIPYQWYHQVTAQPGRTVNVHVWYFRPIKFDKKSCAKSPRGSEPSFSDCTWGYNGPEDHPGTRGGHLGVVTKESPPTRCKRRKPAKGQEL